VNLAATAAVGTALRLAVLNIHPDAQPRDADPDGARKLSTVRALLRLGAGTLPTAPHATRLTQRSRQKIRVHLDGRSFSSSVSTHAYWLNSVPCSSPCGYFSPPPSSPWTDRLYHARPRSPRPRGRQRHDSSLRRLRPRPC
jgi:hypothetical protein